MGRADFLALNARAAQEAAEAKVFANPRNAAAGITPTEGCGDYGKPSAAVFRLCRRGNERRCGRYPRKRFLKQLDGWGFVVNPLSRRAATMDDALSIYDEIAAMRADLDYDIDGVVYKVGLT